jgi:tape measure domain-containing protein
MAQNRTTLVIDSDTRGAESGVRRLATEMSGAKRLATDLSGAFNSLNSSITGTGGALGAMRNLLGTLGLSVGIHELTQYMDAWVNLNARLKLVTNSFQEFKTAQQGVFDIAQSTRQGLKETADLYYKVADSTRSMGLSQQQVLQHTRAISQAIVISGSSADSAKAALVQYGQALASNRLGGDELRSIAEQAPRIFRLIRENIANMSGGFGMTQAQFKAVAAEGYITTEKMIDAVNRGSKSLESEFSKLPLTIGQAWTLLENQMLKFIGSQGESTGVFTAIANGVKLLADNLNHLVNALGVGVASWAAYKAMVFLNIEGMVAAGTANEVRLAGIAAETAAVEANTAVKLANAKANALSTESMVAKSASDSVAASSAAISSEAQLAAALTATNVARSEAVVASRQMALMQGHLRESSVAFAIAESAATSASQARVIAQAELDAVIAASSGLNATLSRQLFIETDVINKLRIAESAELAAKNTLIAAIEREALVNDNLIRTQSQETVALNTLAAAETRLAEAKLAGTDAAAAKLAANRADIANQFKLALANAELTAATTANTIATQANTIAQAESAFAASYTGKAFGFLKAIVIGVKDEFIVLTAAMMRNPFVAIAVAITAVATAAYAYRDSLITIGDKQATIGSLIEASWLNTKEALLDGFSKIGNGWNDLSEKIKNTDLFKSVAESDSFFQIRMFINDFKEFMNKYSLIGVVNKATELESQRQTATAYDVPKPEHFETVARAAEIDKYKALVAKMEAEKNKQEQEAYKIGAFEDVTAKVLEDSKSLNISENHLKKIEQFHKTEIQINELYAKSVKDINENILLAQKNHNIDLEKESKDQLARNEKQRNDALTGLKNLIADEQKKIDDLVKKDNKLSIEIAAKRKNMTASQEAMIENLGSQFSIPPSFLKGLATIESAWKSTAESQKGAQGLFQVMPFNFDKIGASMKDVSNESVFTAKSMKLVAETYQKAGGDVEKFWMLWNSGHISKNIELAPKETREGLRKLVEAIKQYGGEMSNLNELAHEQEQAAKKIADNDRQLTESTAFGKYNATIDELTESFKRGGISQATYSQGIENANETLLKNTDYVQENIKLLDQQAKEYAKLVGHVDDYNATIDELTRNKQRGAITEGEYSLGVAQANAGLMNQVTEKQIKPNAVGEVIDAQNSLDSEKALAKLNDQATKTIDSFNQLGDSGKMAFDGILGGISAVASAASNFGEVMTKLNDSHADYAKNYQAFIEDAKNSEADKAKAKINFEKENAAYQSKTFAAEISGARQLAGAASKMFGEKSAARKAFHAVEMGMSVIEMAMAAKKMVVDVAAGAANMFAQSGWGGFAGVAAMAAVMAGLGFAMSGGSSKVVDNTTPATSEKGTLLGKPDDASNSLERIIDTLNKIHAEEYPELKAMADNFRGVDREMYKLTQAMARSTANFTNMQAIGIPNQPTGAGKSQNPLGSTGTIAANLGASVALGATGAMTTAGLYAGAALVNAGATSLGIGISTAAASTATMAATTGAALGATGAAATIVGGAVLGLVGGLVIAGLQYGLGKLLGIGKVKYQQIGEGIVIESGKLIQNGMITAIDAATWRKDIQTITGWFSDKKKVIETYGQLSDEIYGALNSVSANLTAGVLSIVDILNLGDALGYKLANQELRPYLKIDFWKDGKRVEDTTKLLEDQINAWMDRTAKNVFGALFSQYQKIGEGMMETAVRLTTQLAGVKGAFKKIGFDIGEANLGLVYFSDTLSQMYASSAKADDGLQNFMKAMNDFYDLVTTKGQKSQDATKVTGEYVASIGASGTDIFDPDALRKVMLDNEKQISAAVTAAAAAQNEIAKYAPAVQDAFAPQMASEIAAIIKDSGQTNMAAWQVALGTQNVQDATWATVPEEWANYFKASDPSSVWGRTAAWLDEKQKIQDSGVAALSGKFTSIEEQQAAQQAAEATLKAETEKQAALLANNDELKVQIATSEKLLELQNTYLESKMTGEQKIANQRELLLAKEYKGFEQDLSSSKVLAPMIEAIRATGHQGAITAKDLQKFVWSLEDTAKAAKNLTDANKYIKDFGTNIKDWAMNLRVTSLGSTKSQLDAAALQFESKMRVINNDFLSAEQKRAALSGITGNADQYIQAIRNFYGSSKEGVDKINEVVNFVENLPEQLDVEQMQLNALDKIKSAVDGVGLDVGSILQPSLNKLVEAYKTANKLDAGLYKDALISALDTYGTGILNSAASKDENKQRAAAQIVDSSLSATMGIANSNIAEPDKTAALNALNEATKAAGQFTAAYALMPDETNLALMKQAVTDFTSLISKSAETIGDKNFATVFISALGGFTTALSNSTLSLDVMGSVASGINKAVSAWALAAKLGTEESKTLAAGVIAYGAYLSNTATNYRIDGVQKKEIYAQMSGAALTLFTNVSTNIGKEKLKGYTQDFVDVLIGKGKTDKASAMGAAGVIETLSALLGSQATTYAQRKPLIDKLLEGSDKFVTGYRDLIAKAGESADVKNAMLYLSNGGDTYLKNTTGILDDLAGSTANAEAYLTSGYEKYIENTVAKLKTSSVTDMTVGITTLNGALNDTIKYAADQVNQAIASAKNKVEEVNRVEAARIAAEEAVRKQAEIQAQQASANPVQTVTGQGSSIATNDNSYIFAPDDKTTKFIDISKKISDRAVYVHDGALGKNWVKPSQLEDYLKSNQISSIGNALITSPAINPKDNKELLYKMLKERSLIGNDKGTVTLATRKLMNQDFDKLSFSLMYDGINASVKYRSQDGTEAEIKGFEKYIEDGTLKFATGGVFTNGIVDRPTSFNIGLMGEAGSEGILPLANIGGRLGVHAQISANDSNVDMSETVDELKKQNEQLSELVKQTTALLNLQMAANEELVEKMSDMSESLKTSAKKTRLQAVSP